jgi:hypothetical protein
MRFIVGFLAALFSLPAFAIPTLELKNKLISDSFEEKEMNLVFNVSEKGVYSHNGIPDIAFIFDGKSGVLVNHKEKLIANDSDLSRIMGQQMKLVGQFMPDFKVTATKNTGKVAQWKCKKFNIADKGKAAGQMCAAKMKDIGMSAGEIKIFKSALKSFASFHEAMGNKAFNLYDEVTNKYEMMPVDSQYKVTFTMFGQNKVVKTHLKTESATRLDLGADKFKIPTGYKHPKDLPELMKLFKEQ